MFIKKGNMIRNKKKKGKHSFLKKENKWLRKKKRRKRLTNGCTTTCNTPLRQCNFRKSLIDELTQCYTEKSITTSRRTEAFSMIRDIQALSSSHNYIFFYVPRNLLSCVDVLAKKARISRQNCLF